MAVLNQNGLGKINGKPEILSVCVEKCGKVTDKHFA